MISGRGRRSGPFGGDLQVSARLVGRFVVAIEDSIYSAALYPERADIDPLILHGSALGMGLSIQIRAGENVGCRSRHAIMVLAQEQAAGDDNRWCGTVPTIDADAASRHAFVAWSGRIDDPESPQAVDGYMPNP